MIAIKYNHHSGTHKAIENLVGGFAPCPSCDGTHSVKQWIGADDYNYVDCVACQSRLLVVATTYQGVVDVDWDDVVIRDQCGIHVERHSDLGPAQDLRMAGVK